jgi:hypothetical protein
MFVLLFGLMGVAAIFPVGSHYASRGEQFERGAALADAAFADLKARGVFNPTRWMYAQAPQTSEGGQVRLSGSLLDARLIQPASGNPPGYFNITPPSNNSTLGPGHAFVIDPMGVATIWDSERVRAGNASLSQLDPTIGATYFPFSLFDARNPTGVSSSETTFPKATNTDNPWPVGKASPVALTGFGWPIRRLTVPASSLAIPNMTVASAEALCNLRDDLAIDLPNESDHPGIERWQVNNNGTPDNPSDDIPLTRQYSGGYSWLATVSPVTQYGLDALQPSSSSFGNELYEVSVAVFHKRAPLPSAANERCITAQLQLGGQLLIYGFGGSNSSQNVDMVDAALKDIHAGDWIALAGVHPTNMAIISTVPPSPNINTGQLLFKWYRILSMDDQTEENPTTNAPVSGQVAVRRLMVDGPDWPMPTAGATAGIAPDLRAIIIPGVIGVSTHIMPLEGHGTNRGSYAPAGTMTQQY